MYHNYESWDRCRFCFDGKKNTMPLFQVNAVAQSQMPVWRNHGKELHLRLDPPEKYQLQDFFGSPTWLIFMQIILPALAFLTFFDAISEITRVLRRSRKLCGSGTLGRSNEVSLSVCCLEAPALFIHGSALAAGLYGPKSMPIQFVNISAPAFQGIGVSTNIIIALHLMEESRAFRSGNYTSDVQSIFVRYRYTRLLVCLFALPDVVAGALAYQFGLYQSTSSYLAVLYFIGDFIAAFCECHLLTLSMPLCRPHIFPLLVSYFNFRLHDRGLRPSRAIESIYQK